MASVTATRKSHFPGCRITRFARPDRTISLIPSAGPCCDRNHIHAGGRAVRKPRNRTKRRVTHITDRCIASVRMRARSGNIGSPPPSCQGTREMGGAPEIGWRPPIAARGGSWTLTSRPPSFGAPHRASGAACAERWPRSSAAGFGSDRRNTRFLHQTRRAMVRPRRRDRSAPHADNARRLIQPGNLGCFVNASRRRW